MGLIKFFISKTFFKHLVIAIVLVVLLTWLTVKIIDIYTHHGERLEVPDLTGIQIARAGDFDTKGYFNFVVIDSVYDDHFEKGAIVLQDPPPGSKVKRDRKIYVTIVAIQPEQVIMPDLVDLSLRQALNELYSSGLKLNKLEYVPNFAKNAVLAQMFEEEPIQLGTEILKGSSIKIILGKGLHNEKIRVPFLIGKTESEAIGILNNSSFNIGYLKYLDGRDKMHSKVYQQQPAGTTDYFVDYGYFVDLWLRSDLQFNFDSLLLTFQPDTLNADSLRVDTLLFQR